MRREETSWVELNDLMWKDMIRKSFMGMFLPELIKTKKQSKKSLFISYWALLQPLIVAPLPVRSPSF